MGRTSEERKNRKPYGMVVPKNDFPAHRKATCCDKETVRGESVIVIPVRGEASSTHIVLHRRCIDKLIRTLPLDAADYEARYHRIREVVLETGDPFAKVNHGRKK